MTNKMRGEFAIEIEGQPYKLCLTLGALAEIEDALGVESSDQLGERLQQGVRMRHMIAILGALLRGGGHDVDDARVARLQIDLREAGEWIRGVFEAAGWSDEEENPTPPAPLPGDSSSDGASA